MDSDYRIAKYALEQGYNVAGFAGEFYIGCEFMKPSSYMNEEGPDDHFLKYTVFGTIIDIMPEMGRVEYDKDGDGYYVVEHIAFVYLNQHGHTVADNWHKRLTIYMKIQA